MRVLAHDPYISSAHAERLGAELCGLDRLLAEADFITIHVPLTSATRGLIGARELSLTKQTARLINCARGGIVDEKALHDALQAGRLAGAALDVFAQEPPFDSALLSNAHVVVTPHLGASTREAQVAVSPGLGFGEYGDDYVRFALIENNMRINQAIRGIRKVM